jgi:hypothetical protein
MDDGPYATYMRAMTRLLLALLALLSGLAAQLNTAQARSCSGSATEIGMSAVVGAAQPSVAACAQAVWPPEDRRIRIDTRMPAAEPLRLPTATVLQGVDRARE